MVGQSNLAEDIFHRKKLRRNRARAGASLADALARNRRMIVSGMLAPIELAGSEAGLERRLNTW